MKITQEIWTKNKGWKLLKGQHDLNKPHFVLCFGKGDLITNCSLVDEIERKYRGADIIYCSTSGEIADNKIYDGHISLTAVEFEHTQIETYTTNINFHTDSYDAGTFIGESFKTSKAKHVFVISDGQLVNGTELVRALNDSLSGQVSITGGLAGDGYDFVETLVGKNQQAKKGEIVAIGFIGDRLNIGSGSCGGWDAFGPERIITKSIGNKLFELDNQSALDLYKKYLGPSAEQLPSSALYFPLALSIEPGQENVVRTILSIDEKSGSMTFAGDIPKGASVRLMKHNSDRLIEGAEKAAIASLVSLGQNPKPELAILISCVGRKIVLGQNVDEEVDVVKNLMGEDTAITGFYSYGELAPLEYGENCQLHNQTMTITTLTEK